MEAMEASELRIGNLIWNPVQECAVDVTTRELSQIIFENKYKQNPTPIKFKWQPIPITDEWLEKFGFEYEKGFWQHNKQSIFANSEHSHEGFYFYIGEWNDLNSKPLRYFKYIHQLQNLFHSLTGEELPLS